MQLLLNTIIGKHVTINDVNKNDTIETLKNKIQDKTGISPKYQIISCKSKNCGCNSKYIYDYNINPGDTIYLTLPLYSSNKYD